MEKTNTTQNKYNVTSTIYLDNDMATYNFNENIERIDNNTLLYTGNGNLSSEFPSLEVDREQFTSSTAREKFNDIFDAKDLLDTFKEDCEGLEEDQIDDYTADFF